MTATHWLGRKPDDATDEAIAATGLLHKVWIHDPAAPLFLLVHGRAGNRDVMWTFAHALPTDVNLLLPQGFLDDPDDGGVSWWLKGGMTEENVNRAAEKLTRFLQTSLEHYGLRPQRQLTLGFSQGSALLSVLLQDDPALFAGVGFLAGFVRQRPVQPAETRPSIFMAHGSRDQVIPLEMAETGAVFLRSIGHTDVTFQVDDVEHKVGREGMRQLKSWSKRMLDS